MTSIERYAGCYGGGSHTPAVNLTPLMEGHVGHMLRLRLWVDLIGVDHTAIYLEGAKLFDQVPIN